MCIHNKFQNSENSFEKYIFVYNRKRMLCLILKLTFPNVFTYDRVLGGQLADKKSKIQKLAIQKLFILVSTHGIWVTESKAIICKSPSWYPAGPILVPKGKIFSNNFTSQNAKIQFSKIIFFRFSPKKKTVTNPFFMRIVFFYFKNWRKKNSLPPCLIPLTVQEKV